MSRIHDALKKAEQERTHTEVIEKDGGARASAAIETSRSYVPPPLAGEIGMEAGGRKSMERMQGIDVSEDLLAQCRQLPWNPDKKTMVFFDEKNHVLGAEQFRSLRSHLYMIRKEIPLKKLLITSPLPKEGKTFVAGNLAQAFCQQPDRRVLLIDADLRISGLHVWLGAPPTPGLTDYLSGAASDFDVIQRGPLENLFFIPGGKTVTNPSELIGNGRLKDLLDRLGPAFDWIIVDSPPATLVSDAKLLADVCDGILMVVLARSTPFDLAQKSCLEFRGKKILGAVLNRADGASVYNSFQYYDQARLGMKPGVGKPVEP